MVMYVYALSTEYVFEIMINKTNKRKIGALLLSGLLGGLLFKNNRSYCNLLWLMLFTIQSTRSFLVDCSVAASKVSCAIFSSSWFLVLDVVTVLGLIFCVPLRKRTFQCGNCFKHSKRNSRVHCTIKRFCW